MRAASSTCAARPALDSATSRSALPARSASAWAWGRDRRATGGQFRRRRRLRHVRRHAGVRRAPRQHCSIRPVGRASPPMASIPRARRPSPSSTSTAFPRARGECPTACSRSTTFATVEFARNVIAYSGGCGVRAEIGNSGTSAGSRSRAQSTPIRRRGLGHRSGAGSNPRRRPSQEPRRRGRSGLGSPTIDAGEPGVLYFGDLDVDRDPVGGTADIGGDERARHHAPDTTITKHPKRTIRPRRTEAGEVRLRSTSAAQLHLQARQEAGEAGDDGSLRQEGEARQAPLQGHGDRRGRQHRPQRPTSTMGSEAEAREPPAAYAATARARSRERLTSGSTSSSRKRPV